MKAIRLLAARGVAALLLAARAGLAQNVQINGAGATFPYPIYSKWFSEYNKLHPERARSTTSRSARAAASGSSRNQTVFFGATDGPMTDEQLLAAPGKILHFPTVLGAVVPVYNIPGVDGRAEVHRAGARRHLPRQDHEVERPGDREAQSRASTLPATDITVVHRSDGSGTTYIWVDYLSKVSPEWKKQGRRRDVGELAGRRRRQGQRGRGRPGHADAGLDRLRRADLRAAEQDQLRLGAEHGGRVRAGASVDVGDGRRGRRRRGRCRPTSACRSRTRPARASTRSRRSPGCCSTRTRRTRRRPRSMVDFMKWALTDGQKYCAGPRLRAAAGGGRQARDGGARRRSSSRRDRRAGP